MKLADIRENYYVYSGKVSDVVRQLGLAGIAVIWIFKKDIANQPSVPRLLIFAGIAIIAGLASDLVQYAVGTQIWLNFFNRTDEEANRLSALATSASPPQPFDPEEEDWELPPHINQFPKICFWVKFALIITGYLLLLIFLSDHLRYT